MQTHTDLAVGHLPRRAGVLASHTHRCVTGLEIAGVIEHPRLRVDRRVHRVRQPFAYRYRIPRLFVTKWFNACSCTLARRAAIGWIDFRFPSSINPCR